MRPEHDMNHSILKTIRETEDPRSVFNLAAEYTAMKMKKRWEDHLERDRVEETTNGVETWLCESGIKVARSCLGSLETEDQLQIIDGQIEDRSLEAITGHDTLQIEVQYEAEIALRNEAAYRLTDRGFLPESGWSERLSDEPEPVEA